jgi:hypothetical protein
MGSMNVLLRLLVPAIEGAFLGFLIALFHEQFWPDDLTVPQLRALNKANRWLMIVLPIFAVIFNWRIDLPIPWPWGQ